MKTITSLLASILFVAGVHAQLVADFTVGGSDPTFTFTNTTTGFYDSQIWDFGDGSYGYNVNETHTYTTNGLYLVCLYAIDSTSGNSSTHCDSILVQNASAPGCTVSPVVIDSSGFIYGYNMGTGATGYEWFVYDPNGTLVYNTTSGSTFFYWPNSTGTYQVCLYGYDNAIFCDSSCVSYTVTGGATGGCQASFYWYQDSTFTNSLIVVNTATGSNLTYAWDFGDGGTATGAYPSHTYSSPGIYTVCLTIDDGAGCTDTFCDTMVIVVRANGYDLNVIAPTQVGVEEVQQVEMTLYPNPASSELNIAVDHAGNARADVFSMHGAIVKTVTISNEQSVLNVCDLSDGMYLLRLVDAQGIVLRSERFVVRH